MEPIREYNSVRAMVECVREQKESANLAYRDQRRYTRVNTALAEWDHGPDKALIGRIHELTQKIDSTVKGRTRDEWMPSVAGAYPMVPDYCMGLPEPMRTMQRNESPLAPIKVYIELGLSEKYADSTAVKRAAACAALIVKLSELRPVDAFIICASTIHSRGPNRKVFVRAKMEPKHFDATYIARAMVMQAIVRPIRWECIAECGEYSMLGFAYGMNGESEETRAMHVREHFRMGVEDIYIPAMRAGVSDGRQFNDPAAWVEKYLAPQREIDV